MPMRFADREKTATLPADVLGGDLTWLSEEYMREETRRQPEILRKRRSADRTLVF